MGFHCLQILKEASFCQKKTHNFLFIKANFQIHKNWVCFFISIIWQFHIQEIQAVFFISLTYLLCVCLKLMLIFYFLTLLTYLFSFFLGDFRFFYLCFLWPCRFYLLLINLFSSVQSTVLTLVPIQLFQHLTCSLLRPLSPSLIYLVG